MTLNILLSKFNQVPFILITYLNQSSAKSPTITPLLPPLSPLITAVFILGNHIKSGGINYLNPSSYLEYGSLTGVFFLNQPQTSQVA
jgi:hypothetical protein